MTGNEKDGISDARYRIEVRITNDIVLMYG